MVVKAFIKMIRDVSSVVNDVSATTIINANAITSIQENQTWGEITIGTTKLLEPSANDISGILLGNTIIQGTDFSGIIIGDGNDAQTSYSIALGQGAVASGTEKFVYRDACDNRFVFDTAAGGQFLINGTAPSGSGGGGGTTVPGDLLVHGTMETSGVILAPVHSAEGSLQSVNMELDPSKNPLMTKGMMWINEAQDAGSAWSSVMVMDISNRAFGCAALGGKLYVAGGDDPVASFGTTRAAVYDPITNSWSTIASMDISRCCTTTAALGGKLYAVGGSVAPSGYSTATAEVYDPSANSWQPIASMNTPRDGFVAVALGGKLYAVGGRSFQAGVGYVNLATAEVYDPIDNSWNYIASMSVVRSSPPPCGVALGGKLYMAGGSTDAVTQSPIASVEVYDPIDNSWNYVAPMPVGRLGGGGASLGGKLYVIGGATVASLGFGTDDVLVYNPTTNSWTAAPSLAVPRYSAGAGALGGKLYALGGMGGGSGGTFALNSVEVYDPSLVQMPQITYQGEDFYISHQRGGPKTFIIPHPEHEGKMLRHACLEAPTRGTNVYEYQITTTEDNQTTEIALPSYFKHINGRPRVYVYSGTGSQWGGSRGYMSDDHTKAFIETEKPGTYNVMVTGVRKDPEAVAYSATENIDDPINPKDI